jgi:hypothetical protein
MWIRNFRNICTFHTLFKIRFSTRWSFLYMQQWTYGKQLIHQGFGTSKNLLENKYFLLPRSIDLMILSNFHYQVHHKITLPSWRNLRFKKTDSYSSLQSRIRSSQSSPHYVSWLTGYIKRPDSCTRTHESSDRRTEYESAISEIYVLFTATLKYISRHADHFYICNNEHLEKNLYTKASALRKIKKRRTVIFLNMNLLLRTY